MTPLTKLRTLLSLGAIVGIVPLTCSLLGLSPLLAVALFKAPLFVAPVLVISAVSLWGCWKAYVAAMASKPIPNDKRVVAAVAIALLWGVAWLSVWALATEWEWYSSWLLLYPMPGMTATFMLYVTHRRVAQGSAGGVEAIAD